MAVQDSWPRPLHALTAVKKDAVKLGPLYPPCRIGQVNVRDPIKTVFLFVSQELNKSIMRFVPIKTPCLPAKIRCGKALGNLKPAVCRNSPSMKTGTGKPFLQSEFLLCLDQFQH